MALDTKEKMVMALETMRADWAGLLDGLDGLEPELMEQPGVLGDWRFRDVVSHLTGWRNRTMARFEAAASGGEPAPPQWPAQLSSESEADTNEINNWIYETDKERPLAEVMAESDEVLRRLDMALQAIPEEDLVTPGRFAWMDGYSMAAVLEGSLEHYYVDHAPGLNAWLTAQWRQKATS